jgi:hypothetical protein
MSFLKNKYDKLFQRRDDDTPPIVDRTPKAPETAPTTTEKTEPMQTYTVDELIASLAGKNKYEQLGFTPEQAQSAGAYTPATKSSASKLIGQYGTKQFNYNPETDANYQAYLKLARENGKLAMEDTLAKASAMTGGYSNSNAQLAGQKVYNQHLSEAEANMGNYYAMALDAFNSEQNTLLDRINLAWAEEDRKKADTETQRQNAITDAELKAQYGDYSGLVDLGVSQDAINKYKDTANWSEQYAKEQAALERAITIAQATGNYADLYKLLNYSDEQIAQLNKKQESAIDMSTIIEKVASFTNNSDLETYLDSLEAKQYIDPTTADELYSMYKIPEQKSYADRSWTRESDGGINWGFGDKNIDNNAKVKDEYGDIYTISELKKLLMREGMTSDEAIKYIVNLQKDLLI